MRAKSVWGMSVVECSINGVLERSEIDMLRVSLK